MSTEQNTEWVRGERPPSEEWVEVLAYGDKPKIAMAFYGRDGYRPHWRLPDGSCLEPKAFSTWRRNPNIDQKTGEIYRPCTVADLASGPVDGRVRQFETDPWQPASIAGYTHGDVLFFRCKDDFFYKYAEVPA